jgi:hypothetical protein
MIGIDRKALSATVRRGNQHGLRKNKRSKYHPQKISEINEELSVWKAISDKSALAYKSIHGTRNIPCRHTSDTAFAAYRDAVMNELKVKRADAEAELAAL